jgi:hypothetical protein
LPHGDRITLHRNGENVLESEDDHFNGGCPGIGFYTIPRRDWTRPDFGAWQL